MYTSVRLFRDFNMIIVSLFFLRNFLLPTKQVGTCAILRFNRDSAGIPNIKLWSDSQTYTNAMKLSYLIKLKTTTWRHRENFGMQNLYCKLLETFYSGKSGF
jgi:hypothetical protein